MDRDTSWATRVRKWTGAWFTYGFGLGRLVAGIVFLGVFVGLNVRQVGPLNLATTTMKTLEEQSYYFWGWPLPISVRPAVRRQTELGNWAETAKNEVAAYRMSIEDFRQEYMARIAEIRSRMLPWSHQTYRLLELEILRGEPWCWQGYRFIINTLFALTVLVLILCLQIPRRKVVAKVE